MATAGLSVASDEAPSGQYELDADCELRSETVRCRVIVSDIEVGQPLFQTQIVAQAGSEAGWTASPEYEGTPYQFQVNLEVDDKESWVELQVSRDGELVGRQRIRTLIAESG